MPAAYAYYCFGQAGLPICNRRITDCIRPSWSDARLISGLFPGT